MSEGRQGGSQSRKPRLRAYPPPFRVGDRIRYIGEGGWSRWSGVEEEEEVPMVLPGTVGVVTSNHQGMDADPRLTSEETGEMLPPTDGWSVVKFPGPGESNQAAVSRDALGRFEVATDEPEPGQERP